MRILELEGLWEGMLQDLHLRANIPFVVPQFGFGLKYLLCAWEVRSTFRLNSVTLTVQERPASGT